MVNGAMFSTVIRSLKFMSGVTSWVSTTGGEALEVDAAMKHWRTFLNGSEFKVMRLNDAPSENVVLDAPEFVEKYLRPKLVQSIIHK
jgi:hypothetical protein